MRRVCLATCFGLALPALVSLAGCGKSPDGGGSPVAGVSQDGGPAQAVHQFLEAVRSGNDAQASEMLTPVARQKTEENKMVVAPPGSDTASFKIGEIEMIGEEGAHVASFWTDADEEGNKHTDTIIWMVRKESAGWRIAGMATRVFDDRPPVILNFEEPEDMLAKQQEIEEEMSRRASAETPSEEVADQEEKTETQAASRPSRSKSR